MIVLIPLTILLIAWAIHTRDDDPEGPFRLL